MKKTIYFFYDKFGFGDGDFRRLSVHGDGSKKSIEDSVAYWLGKSPGMRADEIDKILVFDDEYTEDFTYVIQKKRDREIKYEEELREQKERAEYERLRKKFEADSKDYFPFTPKDWPT